MKKTLISLLALAGLAAAEDVTFSSVAALSGYGGLDFNISQGSWLSISGGQWDYDTQHYGRLNSVSLYLIPAAYTQYNMSTGFGVGLVFIYPVFGAILAFSDAVYGDGTKAQKGDDPVSETINSAKEFVSDTFSGKKKDPEALNKLEQLKRMHDDGILSDEEYEKMRKDLMDRI